MNSRLLITVAVVLASRAGFAQDVAAKIDSIAKGYAEKRGFMGSVLAAKGGKVVFEKGYGMANLEWDIPNGPDTKFRLGSITKQFTATAILQLQEAGKLSVSDPIAKYVENAPEAWKPITIHHLLTHTSGIPSYTDMREFRDPKFMRVPMKPLDIAMLSKDKPLEFKPGEKMKYDNTGYVLLGYIVEKVSGEKYDEFLRKHIFEPLDMKDTGYDWTAKLLKHRASGYTRSGASYVNADYLDMSLPFSAGSLYSTVRDLYRWDRALYTEKLLKRASFDAMFTPDKNDYAYGWFIGKINGRKTIAHGGGINGFATHLVRAPDDDAVVIVLSNVIPGVATPIANSMMEALLGGDPKLPWDRKEISVAPDVLQRYAGTYNVGPLPVTVTVENGKLFVEPKGQPKTQAFPSSETEFFLKVVDAVFTFTPPGDGKPMRVTLRQGGNTFTGERVQ